MKRFLLAGAALAALCAQAHSATLSYVDYTGAGSFYAPTTTDFTPTTPTPGFFQTTGSVPGQYTSPFSDTTSLYDVVSGGATATFGGASTSSGTFGTGSGTFSFLWGTPDGYNTISFLNGASTVASFTGAGSPMAGNGTGSYIATISGLGSYDHIVFQSSQNAFEFAAVSPVPLPAALPMFGLAILALGGVAFVGKRRAKTAPAA